MGTGACLQPASSGPERLASEFEQNAAYVRACFWQTELRRCLLGRRRGVFSIERSGRNRRLIPWGGRPLVLVALFVPALRDYPRSCCPPRGEVLREATPGAADADNGRSSSDESREDTKRRLSPPKIATSARVLQLLRIVHGCLFDSVAHGVINRAACQRRFSSSLRMREAVADSGGSETPCASGKCHVRW